MWYWAEILLPFFQACSETGSSAGERAKHCTGSGHSVQPSALQPTRKHQQTPKACLHSAFAGKPGRNCRYTATAPCKAVEHCPPQTLPNIQLPAPAEPLTPTWHFDQEQRHTAFNLQKRRVCKEQGEKKKILLCICLLYRSETFCLGREI